MTNRLLDFSEEPARLSAREGRLRIERPGGANSEIPFTHIAAVIASHGQVSFTQAVLAELAAAKAIMVACDAKHRPVAMALPLIGHGRQTPRFQAQAAAALPLRKRLWAEIVTAKIKAQAGASRRARGSDFGLLPLAGRVRVSNATATEARASQIYWKALFDDKRYARSNEEDARNGLLDYGYAVVRAAVARALCGAGLHPGLGIHHHNQYDPYPLANDVMEPLRPLVDEWAAQWCAAQPSVQWALGRASKAALFKRLTGHFTGTGEARTLFDWAGLWSERLARCLEGTRPQLNLEDLCHANRATPAERPLAGAERVSGHVADGDV